MSSKNPGWHSRRYRTNDKHETARINWQVRQQMKKSSALERQEVADKRTPLEQLQRLDSLLGEMKGARKERSKLLTKVDLYNYKKLLSSAQGRADLDKLVYSLKLR